MGSPYDGETDKEARQHDATQTQEAAPLPPMQSAHLQETSSRNGTITQLDARRVGHTHRTGKQTQSLETGYEITIASSETTARSRVNKAIQLTVTEGISIYNGA